MFTIQELRQLAGKLSVGTFCAQLGPFALIQRPARAAGTFTQIMGLPENVQPTRVASANAIEQGTLALLMEFERLEVATLPPLRHGDELLVGRQPDCDVVIDDPSVSKQHARVRWEATGRRCKLKDLGSTNGTFLNASRVQRELSLRDGDIVSFGDVQFWYVLTETLHHRLIVNR